MSRVLAALGRVPRPLAALLAIATLLSVAWSLVIPPLQGPDEDAHVSYVQRIVETRSLPQDVEVGASGFSSELDRASVQGGLFELPTNPSMKPHTSAADRDAFEAAAEELGSAGRKDGTGPQAANVNPPLYYVYAGVGYALGLPGDFFLRTELMRLMGVPLILLLVTMTWLLVAELLPRPYSARVVGASVAALHPLVGFMSGVVNPDVALAAVWATFFWLAVRMYKRGPTVRSALAIGLVAAASALVQPRGITIGLPAAFAVALALHHHRIPLRAALKPALASIGVAIVGLAGYWLVVRATGDVGGAVGAVTTPASFNPKQFVSYLWQFYLPPLRIMGPLPGNILGFRYVWVESFYGVFGSLDVFLPPWLLQVLYSVSLYGIVAMLLFVVLRWDQVRRNLGPLAILLVGMATYLFTIHYPAFNSIISSQGTLSVLVGRYLLPLLPLMALAVAFVTTSLPRRWSQYAGLAVVVSGVLLSMSALGLSFVRYYA